MKKKRKLKKWVKLFIIIILLFTLFVIINKFDNKKNLKPSNNNNEKKDKYIITTTKAESNEISLVMVGDCLIHRFVYTDALESDGSYNFDKMFTEVSPLISNHDLAYYNQESNIGGKSLGLSAFPRFNSPEEIGDTMVNLGFNLISLANNHTMDKGEQGVLNSVNYWKQKKGIVTAGQLENQTWSLLYWGSFVI